jgi:glyoxylase-like metal-dependent hydrolase (beta-lactamase superfamily II)
VSLRPLSLALLLGCPSALAAQPAQEAELGIEVTRLAEGIYLMRAPSALDQWTSSNSVVFVGTESVVVFDTNALPSTSRLVLDEIRALTDLPVRWVINSHWHMDHWSGNEVYADAFPGLQIVATYRTHDHMAHMPSGFFSISAGVTGARERLALAAESGALEDGTPADDEALAELRADLDGRLAFEAEVAAVRRTLPTLTYADSMTFTVDGRTFELYSVTGDAAGSTVLHLPDERILVTGDVLVRQEDGRGAQPWTMNSYAVSQWLAALRRLEGFDAAIIVPGQGPALHGGAYLQTTRELYGSLIEQTRALLRDEVVLFDDVRAAIDVESFRSRYGLDTPELNEAFDAVVTALVTRIIQEVYDGARPRTLG